MSKWEGKGNNALSLAILAKRLPVIRLLLEKGADININVVYRDADCRVNLDPKIILGALNSGVPLTVSNGRDAFFHVNGGKVTTNIQPDGIKTASMKELAQMSGDKRIMELLSGNSK